MQEMSKITTSFVNSFENQDLDLVRLQEFIKQGADIHAHKDRNKGTVLHYICRQKELSLEMLKWAIDVGKADPDTLDFYGKNCLHYLCENSLNVDAIEYLLKYSIELSKIFDRDGKAPLFRACVNEKLTIEILRVMIKEIKNNGGDPAIKNKNEINCLYYYLRDNKAISLDIIILLLDELVIDINTQDRINKLGYLHILCSRLDVSIDLIEPFINRGIDLNLKNGYGTTALHLVCERHVDWVPYFIEHGADPRTQDNIRCNCFHYLVQPFPQHEIKNYELFCNTFKLLIKHNVDLQQLDSKNRSCLHFACFDRKKLSIKAISFLIEHGLDPKQKSEEGTCLSMACRRWDFELIKYLIEQWDLKIEINTQDKNGKTPLYLACSNAERLKQKSNNDVVQFILEHGGNPNILDNRKMSCLFALCCDAPDFDLIKLIIRQGVDLKSLRRESDGDTFLSAMCQYGNLEWIQYLINECDLKDQINIPNKNGQTALHIACKKVEVDKKDSSELVKYLIEQGGDPNNVDVSKQSCLFLLCNTSASFDLIHWVIRKGADPKIKDQYGDDCLGGFIKREGYKRKKERDGLAIINLFVRNGCQRPPILNSEYSASLASYLMQHKAYQFLIHPTTLFLIDNTKFYKKFGKEDGTPVEKLLYKIGRLIKAYRFVQKDDSFYDGCYEIYRSISFEYAHMYNMHLKKIKEGSFVCLGFFRRHFSDKQISKKMSEMLQVQGYHEMFGLLDQVIERSVNDGVVEKNYPNYSPVPPDPVV